MTSRHLSAAPELTNEIAAVARAVFDTLRRDTHSAQQHRVFIRAFLRMLFPTNGSQSTSAW